jgi:hypothetical protein
VAEVEAVVFRAEQEVREELALLEELAASPLRLTEVPVAQAIHTALVVAVVVLQGSLYRLPQQTRGASREGLEALVVAQQRLVVAVEELVGTEPLLTLAPIPTGEPYREDLVVPEAQVVADFIMLMAVLAVLEFT